MPLAEVRCFSLTLSKMVSLTVLLPGRAQEVGDGTELHSRQHLALADVLRKPGSGNAELVGCS